MAGDPNLQQRLRDGIDAAKRGDKLTARRLLQQVLSADRNNEMALLWMASVVDTPEERRAFLERVLQVNPNNARAREALRRLNVALGEPARSTPPGATGSYVPDWLEERERRFGGLGINWYIIAAVIVGVVILVFLVVNAAGSLRPVEATAVSFEAILATNEALQAGANTPTRDLSPAASPTLPGVVATFNPNAVSPLPPTFTPTFTWTPTRTPRPSATPLPLTSFEIYYSDFDPDASAPSLFVGRADGTGEQRAASGDDGGFRDLAVSPSGDRIAFVRDLNTGEDQPARSQVFVAPVSDPSAAQQLTDLPTTALTQPSWSPDGSEIIFSATTEDGQTDIWAVDIETQTARQLTSGESLDTDPSFSPDGDFIVFASDRDSPGLTEIYRMQANGENVTRLTDDAGSSYAPVYAPDGSRIAFISDRTGDGDLYIMDADGQRPFLVTIDDASAEDRSPTWSPDGRWIVFASNRGGDFDWYAITVSGAEVVQITDVDRTPQSLSFRAQ